MAALDDCLRVVPNLLSCGRLILAPVVVWCIVCDDPATAFFICLLAGATDGLDGWIARRFNAISQFGTILDPLADKVLILVVYISLAVKAWLPFWLALLVVVRDLALVGGVALNSWRSWAAHVRLLKISRVNTVMQIALAAWVLAYRGFSSHDESLDTGRLTALLVAAVACTTLMSAVAYAHRWWREWRRQE